MTSRVELNTWDLAIFALYLVVTLVVGFAVARRGTRTVQGYFLGGRDIPWYVVGASLVTRAALAPLTASKGRIVYLSATSVGRPLPGMGAYETSKAALDEMVRAWRGEHHEIGFCTVAIGNTLGTEVYQSWDPRLLGEHGV